MVRGEQAANGATLAAIRVIVVVQRSSASLVSRAGMTTRRPYTDNQVRTKPRAIY